MKSSLKTCLVLLSREQYGSGLIEDVPRYLVFVKEGEKDAAEPIKTPAIAAAETPLPLMTILLDSIFQTLLSFNESGNQAQ
jgi:hypothetical protein|mmetsp:Transcript_20173/g.36629  ORF Transcript_20173/g.36629 Transcript_20173/m.36629 type:complete len:81 (+) Transcript_20173:2870-3112(+)